jgi:redox-sensitive bicupin YhaK (pirin superfamily)
MSIRAVRRTSRAQPTIEGAGVRLQRAFGFGDPGELDPFLLLDDFRNDRPEHYRAGFPWHPHRGIETITYVLAGNVEHADSLGNKGKLGAGDVQWMTAGSGILHQEMPEGDAAGRMHGFQLWANLPSSLKMTAPRYQDIGATEIPVLGEDDGTQVRVICGDYRGMRGPVDGIAADPRYLDVCVPAGKRATLKVETERHAFAYVFEGGGRFGDRMTSLWCGRRPATDRWSCSTPATRWWWTLAMTACVSCSSPASRSASPSLGTDRSS